MKLGFACALALACAPSFAADKSLPPGFVYQLAAKPMAVIKGDRCEIRGAVWGNGPRAGVAVELIDGTHSYKSRTNHQGIYALSIPFAGRDIALAERPVSPIYVRKDLANQSQVFKPTFLCSQKLTAQLNAQKRSK